MNERAPKERGQNATTILDLLTECRDKVPKDCPESALNLSDATVRQYAKEIEKATWTSRMGLPDYLQMASDLIDQIKEIRDNLPADWQGFSNWLCECTGYPHTHTSSVIKARPLPSQPKSAVQVAPVQIETVSHAPPQAIKTPSFKTGDGEIDPALPAIDAANEKEAMKIDTTASTLTTPDWTPAIDLKAITVPKVFDFYTPKGPAATFGATKDVSPLQPSSLSPASTLESTPSRTDPVVASNNDGMLETILRLLHEERAARIEAEAKRVDAEMKRKQSHDEVLQRIASLEMSNSSLKEAMTDKQKKLDEREAALSKREAAVKALQAKLEADISRQAAVEEAFISKAEEFEKASSQMQANLDRMEEGVEARLARTRTSLTSAKKQEEPVKSTLLASTSNSNDKAVSEVEKVARPKRKSVGRIIKVLKKAFPLEKAVVVFDELKHGVLRMSKIGKAELKDLETQIDELLSLYERQASRRKQHVSMLIDLVNFEDGIGRNDNELYHLLHATIKDAAIEFATERLTKYLFRDSKWLKFREVSAQHKNMQAIKTIAHLGTSLFDMDLALASVEQPDEFDDENTSTTPSEILEKYHGIFTEYGSALRHFLGALPESSPMYELVEAHGGREGRITYESWCKAVRKFDVRF